MNLAAHRSSRGFFVAVLASSFVGSSEMPLLADTPQQTSSTTQRQDDALPDAPQSQSPPTTPNQQPAQAPSGAAGAKAANVKGAPVAQPAGAAVAPARERGHRSLFIKLGLLAGAGIAVGTVVALSEKSQVRPPGATSASHP